MNGVYKVYDKEKNQWIDMPLFFKGDKGEKGDSNVYEGTGENSFALNKVSNEMVTGHYKLTYIENYKYQVITDNVDNLYDYFSEIKSKMSPINGARIVDVEKVDGQLYLTFDDYVDFYWKNPSTKVPKPINGKYFPIGYVQELETAISSNAEGEGSTSFNTGTAKGIASTAINSGRAYGNNSFAEGNGGFGNKFGKHLCADKPDTNEQSGYAGAYGIASHVEGNMTMTTSSGSYAHAEGHSTVVDNFAGHAEGRETYVGGTAAHAEGNGTTSLGEGSHSEGISDKEYISYYGNGSVEDIKSKWVADKNFSIAIGNGSHVEGHNCLAYGEGSHAEGCTTVASGEYSHAEGTAYGGETTEANGHASHAEGGATKALSEVAHTEGLNTVAGRISQIIDPTTGNIRALTNEESLILINEALRIGLITSQSEFNNDVAMKLIGFASHAEGSETKALGTSSHAEGNNTEAASNSSHAEGNSTHAWGEASHAEGYLTESNGNQSHAEGKQTKAQGNSSHAEGIETQALKEASHTEGTKTIANGNSSHSEGIETQTNGWASHAEGGYNVTDGAYSHIEGRGNYIGDNNNYSTEAVDINTKAYCAHAEGQGTKATGNSAHAEGIMATADGLGSHAEGYKTVASGKYSHASGYSTVANGERSFVCGNGTVANNIAEFACGKYNNSQEDTLFSIGIGTKDARKNALEVKTNGDIYILINGVSTKLQDLLK